MASKECVLTISIKNALQLQTAIITEISRELQLERMAGHYLSPPLPNFVCSPMGAVPKKHSFPQKWRVINDLSWPAGHSIKDFTLKDKFTCTYDTLDHAIAFLRSHGSGALTTKLSFAFRHILVNKRNWELLGCTWPVEHNGQMKTAYFLDMFLPFGLRSSPVLFLRGVSPVWHYLDDFWSCGPNSPDATCQRNYDSMQ